MEHVCDVRKKLAEDLSTTARLFAEATVAFGTSRMSQKDYDHFREKTQEARGKADAAYVAFEEHVDLHQCLCESLKTRKSAGGREF